MGREGRAENLSGVGVVYLRRAVLFSSQPHTLGAPISPREAQGCAFNQAGGGLAQHNQSRITGVGGTERQVEADRRQREHKIKVGGERREGVKEKMTEEGERTPTPVHR